MMELLSLIMISVIKCRYTGNVLLNIFYAFPDIELERKFHIFCSAVIKSFITFENGIFTQSTTASLS